MSIRSKLFLSFFLATLVPILCIGTVSYNKAKNAIQKDRITALATIADLKVKTIENFFDERKDDIRVLQHEPVITDNASELSRLEGPATFGYTALKEILDEHLRPVQKVYGYVDIMLADTKGEIFYVANASHLEKDLGKIFPDQGNKAFDEGRQGIYVSDPFINTRESDLPGILITAPIHNSSGRWIGVIALEIDMSPIYALIQDRRGLGETGETLIGREIDGTAHFLSPLRHDDQTTALERVVEFGSKTAIPLQQSVQGQSGQNLAPDYRGKEVIAAWRYIPSLDWGVVAKIDTTEAFSAVSGLRVFLIVTGTLIVIVAGFISIVFAKSITRPIEVLCDGMDIVCQGNMDHKVGTNTQGELAVLAGHFNKMVNTLQVRNQDLIDFKYAVDEAAIVAITDQKGTIQYVNDKFCEISKFSREELIGQDHRIISSGNHTKAFIKDMWTTIANGKIWRGHFKNQAKDGSTYWVDSTIVPFFNQEGKPYQYLAIRTDMTQRKQIEEEVRRLAHYDDLTGLPNRRLFDDRLEQAIDQRQWEKRPFAVIFLDLDRFKIINDTLGHPAGDRVLKHTAERLKGCLRSGDTVARMGGDEFIVLLPEIAKREDVLLVAEKMVSALKAPIYIDQNELFVTGSLGISLYPENGEDAETLMKNADTAMYHAKANGKGRLNFYSPTLHSKSAGDLALDSGLRHALEREEFQLHYQPLVSLKNGKIIGMEALIRWERKGSGLVPPDQFIPLAEQTGMILPIGEWVLKTAVSQLKAWNDAGFPRMTVSVNVSALQFKEPGFIDQVLRIVQSAEIPRSALKLELTESILMKNQEAVVLILEALKDRGVLSSIDDFGTGYSSLSYLKRFPVESLKIDRSFIMNLPDDPDDAVITETIITLGRHLGLNVVAEGIETKEQLVFLQARGCGVGQGYLFSRPLPAADFTNLLKETSKNNCINIALFDGMTL